MKLSVLLEEVSYQCNPVVTDLDIGRITFDTRQVTADSLFVALRGSIRDGHQYIAQALSKGAVAVLIDDPAFASERTILVENCRQLLPVLAQRFFGNPARAVGLYGITGTNGKSTTAWLIFELLRQQ
ncbi:UDP-N-acetylmuramoyl-L-alanyl-D-glutamate--2,6-diaminopimelate ligase, partial [bacterium]|nr:UDP-N-acetylmuramoyl-L-alanyl-D-glutamate--2,6-diaminopimelate ligase [bacterium]